MEKAGKGILLIIAILSVLGLSMTSPILQDQSYHSFSDSNTILNISNFWNVVSNIPFLIVGVLGVVMSKTTTATKAQFLVFFVGVMLVSVGSGYYHLNPNDNTLVWDRLPMTLAFMALFSAIVSEHVNKKIGRAIFIPAIFLGILSILYWVLYDDLRVYIFVQFYPILTIPIILIFIKPANEKSMEYWLLLLAYVIAKIFEHFDHEIHTLTNTISGHSLKHIMASLGILAFILVRFRSEKML